ncbi:protein SSUH2 homolog isoform X2 [Nilaparvata lugens]|uniref:protein SSUH2 homolog isoform X2 n=1 Tax=Nilaparvata lugens TaxID=108931 RepID=UPI00193DCDA7|nr:protein SSUH2 homolog isoform X2 [Nilaparvata lugens]
MRSSSVRTSRRRMPPPRRSSMHSMSISRRGSSIKGHQTEFDEDSGVAPSVPPLEIMEKIPGYENITYEAETVQPPPKRIQNEVKIEPRKDLGRISIPDAQITEEEIRDALNYYVSKHCCYGTSPAKTIDFTLIQPTYTFQYKLETFTERRESSWVCVPYNGSSEVDGPENGDPPLAWDIEVIPKGRFETEVKSIQVPHTSSVKQCLRCAGSGSILCSECRGKGWVRCITCNGEGYSGEGPDQEVCIHCRVSKHGYGRQDCYPCKASGKLLCPPCESTGLLLCYIQLTVTWKTNTSEKIVKKTCLPEKLFNMVTGKEIFSEEGQRVAPLRGFPDESINDVSAELIESHSTRFSDHNIISQRHSITAVPTASVTYLWKGEERHFYLYGLENKIHAPNYPQTCCWGCNVL